MAFHTADILGMVYGASELGLAVFKRARGNATAEDRGSLRILWITILASIAAGFVVPAYVPEAALPAKETITSVGIGFYVVGLLLRWYSVIHLGRFFTVNVAISSDHRVVDTGPYHFVRHPSYTGALLAFLGLGLCIGNAVSVLVILVPITWAFWRRIRWEETALHRALGQAYANYAARTKRLIPGLI